MKENDEMIENKSTVVFESNRIQTITPLKHLCKRVRYRQSECTECVDICPTSAVSLTFGPEINDDCINCGLCAVVCPTQSFDDILNSNEMLLQELLNLREKSQKQNCPDMINIHCHQFITDDEPSIGVNCIGNISEHFLLAANFEGVKDIVISTGSCDQCVLKKGKDLFGHTVSVYEDINKSDKAINITMQYQKNQANVDQKNREENKEVLDRRGFFSKITRDVAYQSAKIITKKEQEIRSVLESEQLNMDVKRLSPRQELLRKILRQLKEYSSEYAFPESRYPWKKMKVDESKCVACGICVAVCPTGALVKETNADLLTRHINYAWCTNCGLCQEACPQDVIEFYGDYQWEDIEEDKNKIVARISLNNCDICGETIPVIEGKICTTCQKRQLLPMFMNA